MPRIVQGNPLVLLSLKVIADFTQLIETNTSWVSPHLNECIFNVRHIVSLLILFSRVPNYATGCGRAACRSGSNKVSETLRFPLPRPT